MLTAEGCASRRKRLWDALPCPCDLLIAADPQHLTYLANYYQSPFVFRSAEAGALLLLEPHKATLVGDSLLEPFLVRAHVDAVVAPSWYDGQRSAPHRGAQLLRSTLDALAKMPGKRIGVELSRTPAGVVEALRSARSGLELIDLDPIIRPLRRAKDADEVDLVRAAIRAADAGQAAGLRGISPGMTELEAFALVQSASLEALGEQAVVYGDFASGPRCEQIGGPPTERVIGTGDLFILDFSVVVHGYRGDHANTFVVGGGSPTDRQRELFEACLAALEAGEAQLRPEVRARDIYHEVHASFAARGLASTFTTHAGHGVGLGHPEPPYIVAQSSDTLVAGDIVTLEPGQYVPGVGGMRYERNYLITRDGFETLTEHRVTIAR